MDCEKVEAALMDELYGELDELTSASLKRHLAGCASCLALMGGLRATRRVAVIPTVEPPPDLEQRILDAAEKASPPPTPLRRRLAGALSVAGGWAMRPQTAMAALFLVTLGTSVLLLRGRSSRAPAIAPVTVVEEGSPAPAAAPFPSGSAPFDSPGDSRNREIPRGALAAARPEPALDSVPPKEHLAPPAAKAAGRGPSADGELALRDDVADRALARKAAAPAGGVRASSGGLPAGQNGASFAAAPAAATPAPAAAPAAPAPAAPMMTPASEGAGAAAADHAPGASPFDAAMAAYRAKRFDEAQHDFDALAAADPDADLWSARSLREGRGCAAAAPRFDQVAQRASGTSTGWEAQLEGARCYASSGDAAAARARLRSLLAVDAFRTRAQAELEKLAHGSGGP